MLRVKCLSEGVLLSDLRVLLTIVRLQLRFPDLAACCVLEQETLFHRVSIHAALIWVITSLLPKYIEDFTFSWLKSVTWNVEAGMIGWLVVFRKINAKCCVNPWHDFPPRRLNRSHLWPTEWSKEALCLSVEIRFSFKLSIFGKYDRKI